MNRGASPFPELILGSAMWGWTVNKKTAFQLLDCFYEAGFRYIDAATNYPINKIPEDFRRSEKILMEWINANGIDDLAVWMKIGSLSNMGTADHNLSPAFLLYNWRYYQGFLGENLAALLFHWDNRIEKEQIAQSLTVLQQIKEAGLEIGFSGLANPGVYAELNQHLGLHFLIQIKHNLGYSDYPKYAPLHHSASFFAYGINGGGIKLDPAAYCESSSLRVRGADVEKAIAFSDRFNRQLTDFNESHPVQALHKMNEVAMAFALLSQELSGILIGPSRLSQLKESLQFYQEIKKGRYNNVFPLLLEIHQSYAPKDRQI